MALTCRRVGLLLLAPLLATVACGRNRVVVHRPVAPLDALVVATMDLAYPPSPYEAALRTEDVLTVLWEESAWAVLTGADVRLRGEPGASLLSGSDLVVRAHELGVDPHRVALLRARATLVEAGGQPDDTADNEVRLILALSDAEGRLLTEVTDRAVLDPFAEHPASDRRPEVRAAIVRATERLVSACAGCFRPVGRLPYAVRANPAAVLAREGASGSPPHRDEMDRFADVFAAVHYFDPELPVAEAERLLAIGTGACLLEDGPNGLVAGDCVVAADGRPVDGPHALARALSHPGVRLDVVPAGATERVSRPYAL